MYKSQQQGGMCASWAFSQGKRNLNFSFMEMNQILITDLRTWWHLCRTYPENIRSLENFWDGIKRL